MESLETGTTSKSEYQVFLNFRGPDTRDGFTDFLYHSLTDASIYVFRDDEELRVGERIDEALQIAIDNSTIYIPIFSSTYASSQWCLRELTQIVKNASNSNKNKEILPIFFNVKPDDVKLKTQLYDNAILDLEREKKLNTEEVDSWREALKKVDEIKGWEAKKYNGQGKLIKLIVEEVVNKLKIKQKPVTEHLVGINDHVAAVRKLLDIDSGDVQLIQIHGMGGIGKTTLAKVVFNELLAHFGKCCCFLENVQENLSRTNGVAELQKKLLSEIGNVAGIKSIDDTEHFLKRIEGTLHDKKVLIVLDDVDNHEQMEKLVGKGALCSGSRVLITTRNEDVLQSTRLKYKMSAYEMNVMNSNDALQLFHRHAFEKDSPSNDHYDISKEIVDATGRLPLTIVVIGSLLKNKTEALWREKLEELRKVPPEHVFKVLKISYDALNFHQQQIFLDIACFFIGEETTNMIHMWRDCEWYPLSGIAVLKNKSLIKIGKDNKFLMHDQLRDLGREIVRNEDMANPEKRSRLWIKDEVLDTIKTTEMKNVEAMKLELYLAQESIKSEEIRRFKKLRFLNLTGGTFDGNLMGCFTKLRWIYWEANGIMGGLPNICLKNVVVLEISSIKDVDDLKLWTLIKEARKLKVLNLAHCHLITETPDLSGCSTLERLTFSSCQRLREINGSIGKLKHLIDLKFDNCPRVQGLPEEFEDLQNLQHFSLKSHGVQELPNFIFKWKSLRELQLSILGPVELSDDIGKLEDLEVLWLEANLKGQLPSEIGLLPKLRELVLRGCDEIRELPALPISLTHLQVKSKSLQVVPNLSKLTNLVDLDLDDGIQIGGQDRIHTGDLRWIERLSNLEQLSLCLLHVPAPIELASLPRLNRLHLSGLNLQPFAQVPSSLSDLTLKNFNSAPLLSSNSKNLSFLKLLHSQMQEIQFDGLQLPNLTMLFINNCRPLERFVLSSIRKLKEVIVEGCPKLDEIHIGGVLESLVTLDIQSCGSFKRFVYVDIHQSSHESTVVLASRVFNKLRGLYLQHCPKILDIQVVGTSESLEYLVLSGQHLQSLGGLSNFKNLKSLRIYSGPELRIVEGLDKLKFLKELVLVECGSLESLIDVSTTQLPKDCCLSIYHCPKLLGAKREFTGPVQSFERYKEDESVPVASTDPLMVWRAESSAQERMRTLGTMEELPAPFEEPQEPNSHETCTCFGGLFFFWSKFGGLFCFKDH